MKSGPYTAEQIIKILDQAQKGEQTVAALCRDHGSAEATFYRWRNAYAGMSMPEAQRLKELEQDNARRKRLLAERLLENDLLKERLEKKGCVWPTNDKLCASCLAVAAR
jgi:putative transposase